MIEDVILQILPHALREFKGHTKGQDIKDNIIIENLMIKFIVFIRFYLFNLDLFYIFISLFSVIYIIIFNFI